MELNGIGIWSGKLRYGEESERRDVAAELEQLGYTALWVPDVSGDVFGALRDLLEPTSTIVAATGILNLWMHTVGEVAQGFAALEADHSGRTLLDIGVSNPLYIEQTHPGQYKKPLHVTRRYLDGLDAAAPAVPRDRRVLAAKGPKMLELARDHAGGAHPFLMTPEHNKAARDVLGEVRCWPPNTTSCSRPTPTAPAPSPARGWLPTCRWRTTRAAGGCSASMTTTSSMAAATSSSTASWRGVTMPPLLPGFGHISTRAATTCASRCSRQPSGRTFLVQNGGHSHRPWAGTRTGPGAMTNGR